MTSVHEQVGEPGRAASPTDGGESWLAPSRFPLHLTAVVGLGAAIRLFYALVVKGDATLRGDEPYFHLTADWLQNLWLHQGHGADPSALHPPLFWVTLLPASFLSSGSSVLLQRATVALIGTATVAVIGLLGRAVAGYRVGLLAALLAAVIPVLWVNDGVLLSESLTGLLVALFLLGCYAYLRRARWQVAVLLGVVCGAAALTRAELLYLVVVALCLPLFGHRSARPVRDVACIVVTALVLVAPWVAWNLTRYEQPVLISGNLGGILCGANNKVAYGDEATGLWERFACPAPKTKPKDISELSDFWTHAGLDHAFEHAGRVPVVVAARLARMTGLYAPNQTAAFEEDTGARPPAVSWLVFFTQFLLLPLAVVGGVRLRQRRIPIFPMVAVIGATFVLAALFYGELRYRVTADVPMLVFAAAAILPRTIPRDDSTRADPAALSAR